jgi:hypothetical protein
MRLRSVSYCALQIGPLNSAVAVQPPLLVRAFCNVPSSESTQQEYPTFRDILIPFVVLTATDFQLQGRCEGCAGTSCISPRATRLCLAFYRALLGCAVSKCTFSAAG